MRKKGNQNFEFMKIFDLFIFSGKVQEADTRFYEAYRQHSKEKY